MPKLKPVQPRPSEVETALCPAGRIMRHPLFARELGDIRAGRPFADDADDRSWSYERGRLLGAIAPPSMRLIDGRQLNLKALQLFSAASDRGLIP
jgi:hypothetical protein